VENGVKHRMILIISICKEKLHELEFVKPIEDILKNNNAKFATKHYSKISKADLQRADKIIICGTSLKDFEYCSSWTELNKFLWIRDFEKPIFGICGGMQAVVKVFDGEIWASGKNIDNRVEIGLTSIKFEREFLGVNGNIWGYSLHKLGVRKIRKNFEVAATSNKGIQAIKHKTKQIYAVLFHPEVRNKEIVEKFIKLS